MKAPHFSTILSQSKVLRAARLALAAPALVMTFSVAQAGTPTTTAADPATVSNWIGFTVGGAFVSGDHSGMMRRTQTNGDFYGGIDSLQMARTLNKTTTLTLDGHAIPGLEDYAANLNVTNTDIGYIKAGFKQYRTWYDGSGGFMPQLSGLYGEPAWGENLSVDRGQYEFEAGLRMEKLPEITFNYKHTFRDGNKDSTTWGARPLLATGTSTTNFEFAPSFWHLDEKSDIFGLDIEHTVGNTDLGVGLNYEHTSYTNSLNTRTGAVSVSPVTGLVTANSQVATAKTDDYTMDLFSSNIHSVTRFSDKLWFTGGFAYTTVNTDTDGWQQLASPVNPAVLPGSTASTVLRTIPMGGSEYEGCVGNLNLMWVPCSDVTITPSVRIEQSSQSAIAQMNTVTTTAAGVITPALQVYSSDGSTHSYTSALDLRYAGISDLVLYAKGEWGQENQSNWYRNVLTASPSAGLNCEGNSTDSQNYTAGTNWYPFRSLSFAMQGLYSERNEEFDPNGKVGTALAPMLMKDHDTITEDINLRMTWHAMNNLSLVTRYDYRETEYDNRGIRWNPNALFPTLPPGTPSTANSSNPKDGIWPEVQSGIVKSSIVSESVTWSPMERLYLQASASYTWSQAYQSTIWVPDSQNDYITGNLSIGYAIDDRTDITASYTYYGANNYEQKGDPYNTATAGASIANAMGYGLNTQEHTVSLTLNRALTANMVWNLRYAFMTSQTTGALQDQSGGANDFTAQMVSTGLQIRF